MPRILFVRRLPEARRPTQGSAHAAGFDLYAASIELDLPRNQLIVDTGLNIAFDHGQVLYLFARSGLALKYGIHLTNGTGVIDADYRGPLKLLLQSDTVGAITLARETIKVGDRVAQAILMPIPQVEWVEQDGLEGHATDRGEGGFGSTGHR